MIHTWFFLFLYSVLRCHWGILHILSVQFSHSVVSDSLWPHGLQHARLSLFITNSQSLLKLISIKSVTPSNPLSSPSLSAFNLSQHQDLFQWVSSSHQVANVLELPFQHQSFQRMFLLSCSVMSDSSWCHGLQQARLPCPSLCLRVCSNSCPSSRWCQPTILSSVAPSAPGFNLSQHQGLIIF